MLNLRDNVYSNKSFKVPAIQSYLFQLKSSHASFNSFEDLQTIFVMKIEKYHRELLMQERPEICPPLHKPLYRVKINPAYISILCTKKGCRFKFFSEFKKIKKE